MCWAWISHAKRCSQVIPSAEQKQVWLPLLLFSHSVVSNCLQPYELQHTRLPCPLLSPGVCSNSCPLIWWYYPTILSSVAPFSSFPQSFPASGSFPMTQFFPSGSQSIGVSASASNEHSGLISFRMNWLDLPAVQGTLKSLLQHHSSIASICQHSIFFMGSHIHTQLLENPQLWLDGPLLAK